jgi:hypothetical protein
MFLSNPASYLIVLIAIFATFTGCGWLETSVNKPVPAVEAPKGKFPFKTREPENFQCDIIETAGSIVRRKRLAMKGLWNRLDLDPGTKEHRAILVTDKEYLIDFGRSIYAEKPEQTRQSGAFSELTRELLLKSPHTGFEEIGRDGDIIQFRARTDGSEKSEVVIHYDTAMELPVKQEFFSLSNGERSFAFSIEIVNFSLEPDPGLFELPAGFRKVGFEELAGKRDL